MSQSDGNSSQLIAAALVEPHAKYAQEYLELLREHQAKGRFLDSRHVDNNLTRLQRDFPAFVESLHAMADPGRTRRGYLPELHYWLVHNEQLVGRSTLRLVLSDLPGLADLGHIGYDVRPSCEGRGFGKRALQLSLEAAAGYGLEKALLTCDSHNIASRKIIEASGGVFERATPIAGRPYERLRYWVATPARA